MKTATSVSSYFIISTLMYFLKGIKATKDMRTGKFVLSADKEIQMNTLFGIKSLSLSAIECGTVCVSNDECDAYGFDSATSNCLGFSGRCQSGVTSLPSTTNLYQRQKEHIYDTKEREYCMRSARGSDYKGTTNVTQSGRDCQRWYLNTPHSHSRHELNYEENYCRNPSPNSDAMPWCYTTDPNTRWEYCNISICVSELQNPCCFGSNRGEDYFGTLRTTEYGKTCQRWDSQSPHTHNYGYLYDQENYCRNPYGEEAAPWCYTTDPNTRWSFCPLPACAADAKQGEDCYRSARGWDYKGTTNVTQSGRDCQIWYLDTPHSHSHHELNYEENYCRNPIPNSDDIPWCYTTDPNTRWEYCNISICVSELQNQSCFGSNRGEDYFGTFNTTEYGNSCQRWDSQSPHNHTYGYLYDQENYCRNPFGGEAAPWCFTTDPDTRWSFCPLPACDIW